MARTVVILIVLFIGYFSATEAALGDNCTDASNCREPSEKCSTAGSCECSNGYVNTSGDCKPSSISLSLSTQHNNVVFGSEVNLTVSVTPEVPLSLIKWLRDSNVLPITQPKYTQTEGQGHVTLKIKNVNFTDSGPYQVNVSYPEGISNTSNQVSINVTGEKPTVMVHETITQMDNTVTIHCNVSNTQNSPALTSVYWLLNGKNLNISDGTKYSGGNVSNPSLSIKNIATTDGGEYHCGATNLVGSSNSSKSVTLAPPSNVLISQQPANPVYNGTRITVNGSYTSAPLNVKDIKWQRMNDGVFSNIDITNDKYNESKATGSIPKLVIKRVDFSDNTSFRLTISNGVGSTSSDAVTLNVIDGSISVTLKSSSDIARYGSDVNLTATITSKASVSLIKWQNVSSGGISTNLNITSPKYIETGVGPGDFTLTIKNLTFIDNGLYQVEVSNAAGSTGKSNQETLSVRAGQFNESCSSQQPCQTSLNLECTTNNRCLCTNAYYHKDQVCHEKSKLAPINIHLNSTTSTFSVFWSPPTTDSELVSEYIVIWKVAETLIGSSGRPSNSENKLTVSSGLISGQLYTVNVISNVTLTGPAQNINVTSPNTTVRTVPMPPGQIILSQSNLADDNLKLVWSPPNNTKVTKYEVKIEETTIGTNGNETVLTGFGDKRFVPGQYYDVSIVTISGTSDVKRSEEHTERIKITSTKPGSPTNVSCPQNALDVSLEISWTAPQKPNGQIIRYQINVSPGDLGPFYTSSNETHKNIEGLSPEQKYIFTINTINDAEDSTSNQSQPITCNTKAGVSSPPTNLEILDIQSRGFSIYFNKPDNVSGILAAYKIIISKGRECIQQILVHENCSNCNITIGCPVSLNHTVSNITSIVAYNASDLKPYTHYTVKVVAINGNGEGHPVNKIVMTEEEVPKKPGQITAKDILSKNLTLGWDLANPSPGNTTYTIYTFEGTDDKGTSFMMKEPTKAYGFEVKTVLVTGLEEYWPYKFKVDAATVKGNRTSEFSNIFKTKQAAPGKVLNLTIVRKGNDYRTAYVSWRPPAPRDHNGVLESYLFSSNETGTMKVEKIQILSPQAAAEKSISVKPEDVYEIMVVLKNNENMTSQASMQSYQAPAGPPPVANIEPITTIPGNVDTQTTIALEINTEYFKNNENGNQVFFGVAVCAKSKCDDMTQNKLRNQHSWIDLPNWHKAKKNGFPMYRATNNTFMDKVMQEGTRQKRSTISASTIKFTIGEDQVCPLLGEDVYCNGPLNQGTSYIVIIFACTNGGCTYNQTAEPFVTQTPAEDTDSNMTIIIGVVIAVVAVSVVVVVAFVVVRRRNRLGETKQYTKGIDNPTNFDEPGTKNIPRKRPIKLKELSDKVAEKHKDSNLHFAREYEDLKALSPKHPAETSEFDENKLKNRYVNILPFDHSRVKLMLTEDDDPSTDFINANYLPGYKSQREYIATQGPIPGTIDDFWRMIWEQNVSIIVMLTLCKEEGRVKCEMYWPENIHEPKQFGDLVVETVSCSTVNFYDFRIFKIKLGDTTRSVKHFHFLQWKDFSANVQNDVMIDFIKNVRNHIRPPDMNGPVVVHCSAGVGRTGTYCALDHLFQFVDEHDLDESIDIFDLVLNLRERRMFMVQTEQQYVFIHDCVRDYVERKRKELQGNLLYENINRGFVADEPEEDSLYQNYSNQRTDL